MKNLTIKDLSIAADLDNKAMSAVRGGTYGNWKMPSCMPTVPVCGYPSHPSYPSSSTTTVTVDQANNQYQSNPTGNCSAVFGGGICADNNQQAGNYIGY
jgi:hypothetical protein